MNKRKSYILLAVASGFTGIGMMLGYSLGDSASNTPLWLGALLLLLGAVLLGMAISSVENKAPQKIDESQENTPKD